MKFLATIFTGLFLAFSPLIQGQEKELPFLYVGHRGASYLAPENTLASITLAWELGADAAECDVMLSSDNELVVFHDKNTQKLTGENYKVSETSWEVLSRLEIPLRESNLKEYVGETIPRLAEVLETIPEDRMLVIEMKTGPEILPHLQKILKEHWKSGTISLIAFDFETIRRAKTLFPEIPCYYLSSFRADVNKRMDDLIESKLDGVDLRHPVINKALMDRCDKAGLDVWCWTVNDPATARKMKALGVTAVTTDRPRWLKEQILSQN